jgi:C4-dicarboxylate transporter, DctM subunit
MTLYILSGILILLALLGSPVFAIIVAVAMLGFYSQGINLSAIAVEIYRIADTPVLLALPLFAFAGYLLGESKTSERLVRLTNAFFGWMPGGLALVAFVACAFFTAFTGATGITIVALGALLYPALKQAGYSESFSIGLVTTSGCLGLLFPPSLPLILYGIIAQQMNIGKNIAINDLFLAGILPGVLIIVLLSLWSLWTNRHLSPPPAPPEGGQAAVLQGKKPGWTAEAISALRECIWEIPLPFFVLGGIYSGFFAVSEAAAATAMYVLIVEVLIYREIKLTQLPGIMRESMVMVGGILLIIGVSMASTNYIIDAEIPMHLFHIIQAHVTSKAVFFMVLNILLLLLGTILNIFSAIVIMVPLILPVASSYGIDPVHLGIVFLANMQIGYLMPPAGIDLFIASYRFDKPITVLYRATLPFIAVLLVALLIITYWPDLSLVFIRR